MPFSLDLPQADRDIWRQCDDLLAASQKTCSDIFFVANAKDYEAMKEQIARTEGDVYLRALMSLDDQTRQWIGKILAGAA
jgi:hypothetical protein